ncbi:MAG: NAD(P)-binding domain-containing protein [Bacilli bacterium]|nr:NAD(P)-binding domain-containing protein [Bacilli bacterium]
MKIVTFEDIKKLNIPVETYYNWTVEMIRNKSKAMLPPKISMKPYDGVFCNVMPSFIPNKDSDYEGVKVVTRYPERLPALDSKLLLLNAKSGEFLALMDADWITAMRTGAVAVHSIMLLAKKNFKTIGMIGLGNVARAVLYTLLELNKDREFVIKLYKFQNDEQLFYERFKNYQNVKWQFVDTYEEAIKGSDVVISCVTVAQNDFCADEVYEEGVLVVPVHTLGFTNCDLFFDKVFADDTGHVCHFKNYAKFKKFAEVNEVENGIKPGRENDKERILAYNIGISLHDINFAAHIYEMLKDNKDILDVEMKNPIDKYWI